MSWLLTFIPCLALGVFLRAAGFVPSRAAVILNRLILSVLLPALVLLQIHQLHIERALLIGAAPLWFVFAASVVFFIGVGRLAGWSRQTIACLILTAGLGNTLFVGLPAIRAFYGADALGLAIIADQAGTFLILSLIIPMVAARETGRGVSGRSQLWRVLSFPPLIALLLAFALKPVTYPEFLVTLLRGLGLLMTPLALIAVGLQLRLAGWRGHAKAIAAGLGFKLGLAPAMAVALFALAGVERTPALSIGLFEAAMPPMISSGIIAMQYGLDAELATLLIGIGIPLSFATLPVWWWILR